MKATLMIEAAPHVLALILANLPAGASVNVATAADEEDDNAPLNTNAPALDSTGLPWDERIHSGNKGVNADGSWKSRRGGPKGAELAAIEAELRAGLATTVASQPMPAPIPVPTPAPIPTAPPVPPVAAPIPVPPMPASPEPAPAEVQDFAQFMQHIQPKMSQTGADGLPVISMEYLATVAARIAQGYNITFNAITDLASQPQYLPYAIQLLQADGRW